MTPTIIGKRTSPADFNEFIKTIFIALPGSIKTIAHKTGIPTAKMAGSSVKILNKGEPMIAIASEMSSEVTNAIFNVRSPRYNALSYSFAPIYTVQLKAASPWQLLK